MATISLRKGFRWLDTPTPISEPTTTTVLSSPNHLFVDIRIFKSEPSSAPTTDPSLLDWAIAGTSSSIPTGPSTSHSTFHQWISSRPLTTDEGDMDPHPDYPGLVRELGSMINPETGKMTPYEEIWDDQTQSPDTPCVVLRYKGGKSNGNGPDDENSEEKGLCVLVGEICQSIARTKSGIHVQRWEQNKQTVKIGSLRMPCEELVSGKIERKVGAAWADDGGREWKVVEV